MASIGAYQTKLHGRLFRVRYNKPDGHRTDRRGFADRAAAQAFADVVREHEPRQLNHRTAVINALESYQRSS